MTLTDSEASMGLEMATSRKEREEQEKAAHEERVKDPITGAVGNLGPWQVTVCIFIFLVKFPVGWHQLSTVFLAPSPSYECVVPNNLTDACSADCSEIRYDTSVFTNTIITEWNLICSQKYLASWVQTLFMFGILVGSVLFGILSDKYGRRPPLMLAVILQLICGVGEAFVPWFTVFAILRFLLAVATGGSMVTSFVLTMEIVGPKKRETMSILYQIPFNIGHTTLPLFAYFLRDWRWFQFAISIVSVVYISYYWILPESPRWLLANGKIDEVEKLLVHGAERNHRSTKTIRSDLDEHMSRKALLSETDLKEKAHGTLIDLFKYPNLRIRTLVMGFNWLVCGLTYFGVSQYIGEISGNIFVNVAISGMIGIPGTLISIPATKVLGRKKALILSNCVAGISLLLIAVLGKKGGWVQVGLASIGVFGMSVSFPNVYLYGGELFPTVARNAAMGFLSMAARIGAMVAPFVSGTSSISGWLPAVLFGCPSLIASLLVLLLPETKGQPLPETIEDGENFGKKKAGEK